MNINDLQTGKVKLEFGNQEQINLIDAYEKIKRLDALEDNEEILKEYRCIFAISGNLEIVVEAYNKDEARELAEDEKHSHGFLDMEIEDIDFIESFIIGEV